MSGLYKDLAPVYEAMYQTFIDYEEEYTFYSEILKRYDKQNLLEIGSGTGHLARYFVDNGYDYQGLDYSPEMIALSSQRAPECTFIHGDMSDFQLNQPVDSIIAAGRTISYLLSNQSVNDAIACFYNNLNPGGIVCFDFIDASRFIPTISKSKTVKHEATHDDTTYIRESIWRPNLKYGWDFHWHSSFYKAEETLNTIGEEESVIRTFTLDEVRLFLSLNGFTVSEEIDRPSYAFPTYVIVAQK